MTEAAQVEAVRRLVRESVASVDALAPGALQAVMPALRAARDELRADLLAWLQHAPAGAERFTAYQKQEALRSLEAALERVGDLQPAIAAGLAKARHSTGPLAIANLETEIHRLSAIFGGGVPTIAQIDAAAVIAKGDKLLWRRHERSAARYAGAVGEDIRHQLSIGVAKGESIEQLVTRLRRFGDPAAKLRPLDPGADADAIAGGLFRRHKFWADRLVRTEVMNTYNVQHDASIEYANEHRPEGDEEFLRRWDAAADVRVCVLCSALDGMVTTIGGVFPGGISGPPRHPCCRCIVLAWLRRWGDLQGERQARGRVPETEPMPLESTGREMRIGGKGTRIGEGNDDAAPAIAPVAARRTSSEAAAREAIDRAEREMVRKAAELADRDAAAVHAAAPRGTTSIWRPGDETRVRRQVVELAKPAITESDYERDIRRGSERQEAARRMHARAAAQRAEIPERAELPRAETVQRKTWLRWPWKK